jgi:hypothetical protein
MGLNNLIQGDASKNSKGIDSPKKGGYIPTSMRRDSTVGFGDNTPSGGKVLRWG